MWRKYDGFVTKKRMSHRIVGKTSIYAPEKRHEGMCRLTLYLDFQPHIDYSCAKGNPGHRMMCINQGRCNTWQHREAVHPPGPRSAGAIPAGPVMLRCWA